MKRFLSVCLTAAMLLSLFVVSTATATAAEEAPKDYSENLVVYWDFEDNDDGTKLVDKATAGAYASNLTEYGTDTASVSYANGSVTVPKDAGVYLLSSYLKTDEINSAKEEMTVGVKLNIDNIDTNKQSFLVAKANHFAFMIYDCDLTAKTYKIKYRHETNSGAEVSLDKDFECGKDYYVFVTVKLNSDKQAATAFAYWSEDGVSFTQGASNPALTLTANAKTNEGIIRSGLNAAINLGTTGNAKANAATYEVSFDDVWFYNAAVEAGSLPVIAQNRNHRDTTDPSDYSENMLVYWDFAPTPAGGRLVDKATAGAYASNLTEYGTDTASVSYANGSVTIPKDAGVYLLSSYLKTDEINSAKEEMTVGVKLNIDNIDTNKQSFLVAKANHFAFMIYDCDLTAKTYKIKYRHETSGSAEVSLDKDFECGKDYYVFVTVKLNSDKQAATAFAYWSEDGVSFTQGASNTALTLTANAQANEGIIRSGLNAPINLGTTGNAKANAATFEVSFDDVWFFNAAVEAESLPVIVKNRFHYTDGEEKDAPAFRGSQTTPVASERFDLRLVGTVDSLDYAEIGFKVQLTGYKGESYDAMYYWTSTVYNEIIGNAGGNLISYTAADLGGAYIYALELKAFPYDDNPMVIQVTVCYRTEAEGEVLLGDTYEITLQSGKVTAQQMVTQ